MVGFRENRILQFMKCLIQFSEKNENKKCYLSAKVFVSWEFYSPVKTVNIMLSRSVNLLTLFAGQA